MDAKRSTIVIYHFDKSKRLDLIETLRTKALTKPEFDKVLKRELAWRKDFCFEIRGGHK